jgi:hypothetical protein
VIAVGGFYSIEVRGRNAFFHIPPPVLPPAAVSSGSAAVAAAVLPSLPPSLPFPASVSSDGGGRLGQTGSIISSGSSSVRLGRVVSAVSSGVVAVAAVLSPLLPPTAFVSSGSSVRAAVPAVSSGISAVAAAVLPSLPPSLPLPASVSSDGGVRLGQTGSIISSGSSSVRLGRVVSAVSFGVVAVAAVLPPSLPPSLPPPAAVSSGSGDGERGVAGSDMFMGKFVATDQILHEVKQ